MRTLVKGERWLLLTRWANLTGGKRQELNQLFALNRKVFKAYLLKESPDRLWSYRYEGAMLNYLQRWIDARDDATGPPRWAPELLPDEGASRCRRGDQRKHQSSLTPGSRL